MVPFIRKTYSDAYYVFWPYLASSHYAKSVQEYLKADKINFASKEEKPAVLLS